MPTIKTPEEILELAPVANYLAFNDKGNKSFLKGGFIDNRLPLMIACERHCVQWTFDTDPTDATLRGTSNYLYNLLGIYGLSAENVIFQASQEPPVVAGPSDQSVNVGATVTFTISVTSTIDYTIKWFKNGVEVPGETSLSLSIPNAQLADSGAVYSAVVTNAAGVGYSDNATLTVTQVIMGRALYTQNDPYALLAAGRNLTDYGYTWQIEFEIDNLQPFNVVFPADIPPLTYMVVEYPATQLFKNIWFNTPLNSGNIPDSVMANIQLIGDKYYIVTRQGEPMNITGGSGTPMIFSGNVTPSPFGFMIQPQDVTVAANVPFQLTATVQYGKAIYNYEWRSSSNDTGDNSSNNPKSTLSWIDTITKTWTLTVTDSTGAIIISNTITVTII